jgi:hypothetical protein
MLHIVEQFVTIILRRQRAGIKYPLHQMREPLPLRGAYHAQFACTAGIGCDHLNFTQQDVGSRQRAVIIEVVAQRLVHNATGGQCEVINLQWYRTRRFQQTAIVR